MHKVSPSQITEADRCLRRWWWQSVKGFRKPDTASTVFGSNVHAALEARVLNGAYPAGVSQDVLDCAVAAYDALGTVLHRAPSVDLGDEVEMEWSLPAGYQYPLESRGRIDMVLPSEATILDWKTTSSLKWAKTAETLAEDPQVIMYTDAALAAGVMRLPVTFLHVYTQTKGKPAAQVVRTMVTAESLSVGQARMRRTMQRMAAVLEEDRAPDEVEANILACGDYGGCPHRERCFGQAAEEEQDMNVFEKLAARRAAQGVQAEGINPPDVAPTPVADTSPPAAWQAPAEPVKDPAACVPTVAPPQDPPKATKAKAKAPVIHAGSSDVLLAKLHAKPGRMLLVGAFPLVHDGEPYGPDGWTLADEWLAPFAAQAAESLRVAHWTVAEYGKGKGAVVALVAEACRQGNVPQNLILDRRSQLADAVYEVLVPHFRNVYCKMG